jgi:drug/metabolite transporter (DMT)-like permease
LTSRFSDTSRSAAWMMAAILASTTELVLVHALGSGWAPTLQLFWRQSAGLLILSPLIVRSGARAFRSASPKIIVFRSITAMLAMLLWIYATSHLPLATATTLSFTRPLFIVLLAWLVLGERIARAKSLALIIGFAGVLLMVRPGVSVAAPYAVGAALLSSLMFAASFISIKAMTANNDPLVIMVYSCIFGISITAWPALTMWRTPSLIEVLLLAGLGVTSLAAFGCMLKALSLQGAAALMPLDYIRLPLASLIGLLLFNERPDGAALAGGALIMVAALSTAVGDRTTKGKPPALG